MKGFLRRDFALISGTLRFYLIFIAIFGAAAIFGDMNSSFMMLYVAIFVMSSVTGLFSYDEFNHWMAYAAAVPDGRRDMVKARYTTLLLLAAGQVVLQLLLGTLAGEKGVVHAAALYSGLLLIYSSLSLPLSYHFGGTKARMVTVVLVGVLAGLTAIGGTLLSISTGYGERSLPEVLLFVPLVGLALLAVSYRLSLGIMAKKEL